MTLNNFLKYIFIHLYTWNLNLLCSKITEILFKYYYFSGHSQSRNYFPADPLPKKLFYLIHYSKLINSKKTLI